LPHINGDALANSQNIDLAALGISFPGVPNVVGPFGHYDFRLSANQSLIDRHSYHNWKASEKQEEAAKLDYQDARDLVIRQAAGLYLNSQASAAEVEAAESRVTTSQTLEKLARDQHAQGLATAVDEVRAQVQLARDQQTVLVARNAYQTSLLALAHFLGISPGAPLELAESLKFHHVESTDAAQALHVAREARSDYAALLKQRDSLDEQLKASRARYLPTLSVNGDYGAIGRGFNTMAGTGEIQGTVTVTLFDRDRAGEKTELQSQVKRLNAQIDDLNREIEQELRTAVLNLESTESQVTLTEGALHLAERELSLAQDRFRNGVTDNIEVVTAQASLASAQDDRITALAQHADAIMALARSLGGTEKIYQTYLREP
jgi:outer membrane protein TolC